MEGAEKNILQVHNLSIGYISAPLFEKINFSVSQNQIAAVIGMNGTGKSTLLRTLCNLQSPLAGKVFIAGKDIVSFSAQELARIISIVLPGRAEAVQVLSVSEILFFARAPYTGYLHKLQKTDFEI
ncbi:MAG: ATP-binding cassette domain-containing protein, partial [Chitinophagales bacterium]